MDCGILVPQPGIDPALLAVKAWSPNHLTSREFPSEDILDGQLVTRQQTRKKKPIYYPTPVYSHISFTSDFFTAFDFCLPKLAYKQKKKNKINYDQIEQKSTIFPLTVCCKKKKVENSPSTAN